MPDLHRIPGAQPRLLGLAQYGGEPLAVVDVQGLEGDTEEIVGGRGTMVVIAPGDGLLIGLAADDAEHVTRLADVAAVIRPAGPISNVDADGVKRLDPSWFLARAEGPSEETEPDGT